MVDTKLASTVSLLLKMGEEAANYLPPKNPDRCFVWARLKEKANYGGLGSGGKMELEMVNSHKPAPGPMVE